MNTPWISASTAHLLLECSARWVADASVNGPPPQTSANGSDGLELSATLGTLVHKAVEQWINTGHWRTPARDSLIVHAFGDAAVHAGAAIGITRRLSSALGAQLGLLRACLNESASAAEAEVSREDWRNRIRGRIDVLGTAPDRSIVIDVKTGVTRRRDGTILDEIETQMAVYGWLILTTGEPWPDLIVVGLRDGTSRLELEQKAAEQRIRELLNARNVALSAAVATPTAKTCRHCRLRADCSAHWDAVTEGLLEDAFEGSLTRSEASETGRLAFILTADGRETLLRGVEAATVIGSPRPGDVIRAVRVRRGTDPSRWTAGAQSLLWVHGRS